MQASVGTRRKWSLLMGKKQEGLQSCGFIGLVSGGRLSFEVWKVSQPEEVVEMWLDMKWPEM